MKVKDREGEEKGGGLRRVKMHRVEKCWVRVLKVLGKKAREES